MRDARPGDPGEGIQVDRVAVVVLQQLRVGLGQDLRRDRLVLLDQPVRPQLVVGEHHLRVERAGDVVDGVLQEDDPLGRIGRALASMYSSSSASLSVDGTSATKMV